MSVITSKVSVEFNKIWALTYPDLFTKKVFDFGAQYPSTKWDHKIDFTRDGFVYIIAILKETK